MAAGEKYGIKQVVGEIKRFQEMKMNRQSIFLRTLIFVLALIILSGCVSNIIGTRVRQPKEGERGSYSQVFDCDYPSCFEEVQNIIIENMHAKISYKNPKKGLISAMYFNSYYKNCNSTTEALISFEKVEAEKIKIIVASGNYGLAQIVSVKIFTTLEKKFPAKN